VWSEKIVILCLLALVLYILFLSWSFVPVMNNRFLVGPVVFPPCGFKMTTGLPCISCYMTRSFALMVRGRILEAIRLQPMGALLFSLVALSVPALFLALIRRESVWPILETWPWKRFILFLVLGALASWGYTILMEVNGWNP